MIVRLPRYFIGYVTFEISGSGCENFINLCRKNGIDLFLLSRKNNKIIANCLVCNYKKIPGIHPKGVKIKIIKRVGFRFIIKRYRKRAGIATGAILGVLILIFLSGFVWNIDVSGNERLSENVIIDSLKEYGFFIGAKKSDFYISDIENKMMIKLPDLGRISINLDGSFAHIIVKEREMAPIYEDKTYPSNLIAKFDGQILKTEITKGKPIAKVGSGVVKGELLVSGFYNDKKDNIILEHSSGKVTALVEFSKTFETQYVSNETVGTEIKTFYALDVLNKRLNLSFGKENKYNDLEYSEERKKLEIFGIEFPVSIIVKTYKNDIISEIKISNDTAKEKIKLAIQNYEKSELYGAEIKQKNIRWIFDDKVCRAVIDYSIITDIAEQQKIETENLKLS